MPVWVWFHWIPQLLTSLQRPEAVHVKPVLQQLAMAHPQSLYYALRTYLLSLRENAQRAMAEMARAKQQAAAAAAAAAGARAGEEAGVQLMRGQGGGWRSRILFARGYQQIVVH